jgi:hypothetical protein
LDNIANNTAIKIITLAIHGLPAPSNGDVVVAFDTLIYQALEYPNFGASIQRKQLLAAQEKIR